jgi:hypothetical protein
VTGRFWPKAAARSRLDTLELAPPPVARIGVQRSTPPPAAIHASTWQIDTAFSRAFRRREYGLPPAA